LTLKSNRTIGMLVNGTIEGSEKMHWIIGDSWEDSEFSDDDTKHGWLIGNDQVVAEMGLRRSNVVKVKWFEHKMGDIGINKPQSGPGEYAISIAITGGYWMVRMWLFHAAKVSLNSQAHRCFAHCGWSCRRFGLEGTAQFPPDETPSNRNPAARRDVPGSVSKINV
jgi:hypothetical protein